MTLKVAASRARVAGPVLVVALAVMLLLAACGGGDAGTGGDGAALPAQEDRAEEPGTAIDPCTLVTKDEMEEALGAPVGEPERPSEANIPPYLSTCRWTAERGEGVAVAVVSVRTAATVDELKSGFESVKEQFPDAQDVPGLGDGAFYGFEQLHVLRGDVYLTISGDFDLEVAKGLAEKALDRLP